MRRFEPLLVGALCLAIGWFYLWTVRSNGDMPRFGREQSDYFNLLIDGWLDGQLHLKVEVPEALLKLKDPYDPKLRPPGLAHHDASLYRGRYYIYFGVGPVVTLMLPYRLLTGLDLPLAVAVLTFVYGGFLVSVALWLAIRRRYFPASGVTTLAAGVLALGLATVAPLLLRRPHMWELPIAAAYAFTMLTLFCIFFSLHSRRRAQWFAGAALALGLAIASRPSYLLASPLLAVPLAWWWREERRIPWRVALAAAAPLAVIGSLMALHNYLRFDHPLQFGQAYQLSHDYERRVTHFSSTYWSFNAWRYLFSPAEWSRYYPFIEPARLPPKPPGFSGHDDVYGVLVNLPLAWFALAAPLAIWKRSTVERGRLGAWLGAAAVLFVIMAALMLSFFGSLGRYLVDFTPTWMMLACVGILSVERYAQAWSTRAWRASAWVAWTAATTFSAVFGVLYTLQFTRFFRDRNPAGDFAVARLLNRVPAWGERVFGVKHGPLTLQIALPRDRIGETEPLVTTGAAGKADRVFVHYLDREQIQLGFVHGAARPQLSRPLSAPRDRAHRVTIAAGMLYPPESHPFFADMPASGIAQLCRRLRIAFNGEPVLEGSQSFFEATSGTPAIGTTAKGDPAPKRFTGKLLSVARREISADEAVAASRGEHLRLRLRFNPSAVGQREPLLSFRNADGDEAIFFVRQIAPQQMRFGLVSSKESAGDAQESDAIPLRAGVREVRITVSPRRRTEATPAPHPAQEGIEKGRATTAGRAGTSGKFLTILAGPALPSSPFFDALQELKIEVDHTIVWTQPCSLPPGALTEAMVVDRLSVAREAPRFSGEIHSIERYQNGADPLWSNTGALTLRLKLPAGRVGRREPLLVTGQTGAGNIFSVEYLDANTVRFAYDLWGLPTVFSETCRIDYSRLHDVEIIWGGFEVRPSTARRSVEEKPLEVRVDGELVWKTTALFYPSEPEDLFIGREPLGGTTSELEFSGEILSASRGVR